LKKKIIACDLGTGGNKASLFTEDGICLAKTFVPYKTYYPAAGFHEQRPSDWWEAVVKSTARLMHNAGNPKSIECISFSGHSLGAVPIDKNGQLLREFTPIWSDTRAEKQAFDFFNRTGEPDWYMATGNGFPPPCYTVFKMMWYRDNEPDIFSRTYKILGTKDFINYRLTGTIQTDYSYASGSGVYDLRKWAYSSELVDASGLSADLLPDIVPSTKVVGTLTEEAARELGLSGDVKVVCGGVDNSCMALGARNIGEGRVYTSLGSSAWIAVSSKNPVLDSETRPFVFTHVIPEMFTSAVSVFSAGSSLNWVLENLFAGLQREARETGRDAYELFNELAEKAPAGAHNLIFNPSLAGGTSQDPDVHIRGAYRSRTCTG
jgi:xylulokinase